MAALARWPAAVVLWSIPLAAAPPAFAGDPPATTLPPRPVSDSLERVVERMEQERKEPCARAHAEGVPCFPVATDLDGPIFSVRDSLRDLGATGQSPNWPPTLSEMAPFRPGSHALSVPLASFDPVCGVKSAVKALRGKNDVYYLYRVRDAHGERVALYDHELDAASYQGNVELIGRFEGECEAVAAYRARAREQQKNANR